MEKLQVQLQEAEQQLAKRSTEAEVALAEAVRREERWMTECTAAKEGARKAQEEGDERLER